MAMDAFTLAKKYYPEYWGEDRLDNLVRLNKLTAEQYKEITGKEYGVEDTEPKEEVAEDVTEDPEASKEPAEGSAEGAVE